ncbi:MAG: T9SS type A sorting domain-containing protein [Flavobacteriales bacterium]
MRTTVTLPVLFLTILCAAQHDYRLNTDVAIRGHQLARSDAGDLYTVVERRYGNDSTTVEVRPGGPPGVQPGHAFRLQFPVTWVNSAAALDDGVLVAGTNRSALVQPCLFKAGADGAMEWYHHFDDLAHGQDQLVELITAGDAFAVYSYPGGTYRDGVYRINGTSAGPTDAVHVSTGGHEFRVSAAAATNGAEHLVGGSIYPMGSQNTKDVLLMRTDPNGASWMRSYDMGSSAPIAQSESVGDIIRLVDGNHLVIGTYSDNSNVLQGFLMKVDGDGTVLWCKRYTNGNGGLLLSSAYEYPDGTLAVSGGNSALQGMLLFVDASGGSPSTQTYNNTGSSATSLLSTFTLADEVRLRAGTGGQLLFDAQCDMVQGPVVIATDHDPVVTTVGFSAEVVVPGTWDPTYQERSTVMEWEVSCLTERIGEQEGAAPLVAYPVPTNGAVRLAGDVRNGDAVEVRSMLGRVVRRTRYMGQVDLSALPAGAYVLINERTGMRVRVVRDQH